MTKLEEFWCKGYSFRAIFGQDTCTKWKTLGKNTEKHSTSKKGESLKLINLLITIFEKENLVLEGHKVFPPHTLRPPTVWSNTEILLLLENKIQYS